MCSIPHFPRTMRDRRGFTMIELLVAMVISGLLVGVIFQIMEGNSRFVRLQAAREEVQQNGRAALDLIAGELRGIPAGGIVAMTAGSIEFRLPRGWGILCNTVDASTTTAWVLFPDGALPADFQSGVQNWGIAVEQTPDPSQNTGAWKFVSAVGGPGTADPCDALVPQSPNQRAGFSSGTDFVNAGVTAQPGTMVMVFEQMKYDVEESAGTVPGHWVRRAMGWNSGANSLNMQPMAGPVSSVGGLTLSYFEENGVTETTDPAAVRLVRVRVITESRAKSERAGVFQAEQVDTTTTDVFLRN